MSVFFGTAFFVNGVILPFFPVVLSAKGLTGQEIAFIIATPHVMRLFSMPILSGLADRSSDRRLVMFWLVAITLAATLLMGYVTQRWAVMAMGSLLLILSYCVGPLADTIAILMERNGLGDYGKMRLWGSASFIMGNLVGGVVMEHSGVPSVYLLIIFGFVLSASTSFLIPPAQAQKAEASVAALTILRRPAFLGVLLGHGLIQSGHAALYGFATLVWQQRGYDDMSIGVFWAIGVIAEIMLFSVAGRMLSSVPPLTLMALGGVIGFGRWVLFTLDTGTTVTGALQILHAGSFALAHIGLMRFIREVVPEQRASSAQGTYMIFNGLGMALATAIAGRLWPVIGEDCFYAMSAFCLAGLVILMISRSGISRLPVVTPNAVLA
ncbi:MFS transporter [Oryzibacter oryziterrae]|uniref:MFS transporter n=1 Tax=Oryzibacter oryziterrae TaxID=2766474 RepID=UPI001F17E1FD|nr:MFS transporter [Oryzibacter oryziterrae]